jgi:GGDEF domain-containing protein
MKTTQRGMDMMAGRGFLDKLIQKMADLAMYEAKNAGGNRVVLASEHIGV